MAEPQSALTPISIHCSRVRSRLRVVWPQSVRVSMGQGSGSYYTVLIGIGVFTFSCQESFSAWFADRRPPKRASYGGGTRAYKVHLEHAAHEALVKLFSVPGRRGLLPPVDFENKDLRRVKTHIIEYGAAQEVVDLCDEVFKNGLTREALERCSTVASLALETGRGTRYFLRRSRGRARSRQRTVAVSVQEIAQEPPRCSASVRKDHFGFSFECLYW